MRSCDPDCHPLDVEALLKSPSLLSSQYFKALSLEYDSNQLLGARDRAAPSAAREPSPSLRSIADESYYEARLLWVSRHILAATVLRVKDDGEETEERMAVSLDGVRRLFVEELAAEGQSVSWPWDS